MRPPPAESVQRLLRSGDVRGDGHDLALREAEAEIHEFDASGYGAKRPSETTASPAATSLLALRFDIRVGPL